MKDWSNVFRKKMISIEAAVQKVKSDTDVVVAMGASEPRGILSQLHTQADRVRNVKVFSAVMLNTYPFFMDPDMAGAFEFCSWFYSNAARAAFGVNPKNVSYQPNVLRRIALDRPFYRKPHIFFGTCTPPDRHGFISLGFGNSYEKTMIEQADITVLEVNENVPWTYGDMELHIRDIDFFVEHHCLAPVISNPPPGDIDRVIGRHVSDLVEDGSTIQVGIGNIPNAVAEALADKNDLGIHTEMIVDSMMTLYEKGVITNKCKSLYKGKSVCSFVLGSQELYDWSDRNPSIMMLRGEHVNDPAIIRNNSKMTSINTCLMVDLSGQVASESLGMNHYSGTGGQTDTAVGAKEGYDQKGKSIITCYATAKSGTATRIVPVLPEGTAVTLHRGNSDYIVTEYGVAWLRGKTIKERAASLIEIAHPDFRDYLRDEAKRIGYL